MREHTSIEKPMQHDNCHKNENVGGRVKTIRLNDLLKSAFPVFQNPSTITFLRHRLIPIRIFFDTVFFIKPKQTT